jgi:hypothetical protein
MGCAMLPSAGETSDTVADLGQRGEFLPQTHLHAGVAVQRLAQRLIQQRLVNRR